MPSESVAWTVKEKLPVAVGVPDNTPLEESVSPGGKLCPATETIENVNGARKSFGLRKLISFGVSLLEKFAALETVKVWL